jgi:hypothetical protein
MIEILTPLSKCIRVSRAIDPATFVAAPGSWAGVAADGSLVAVSTTPAKVNKLVIGSSSNNKYESHDVEVGRITTLEGPVGLRFKITSDHYVGTPGQGTYLVPSSEALELGKLRLIVGATTGTYENVARVEQAGTGFLICTLISPTLEAIVT